MADQTERTTLELAGIESSCGFLVEMHEQRTLLSTATYSELRDLRIAVADMQAVQARAHVGEAARQLRARNH
jgi:hypothetical protein